MDRRTFLKTVAEVAGVARFGHVASVANTVSGASLVGTVRTERRSEAATSGPLTLAAVGDCILARRVGETPDPDFLALVALLRGTDAVWGNYELVEADPREADPRAVLAPWPAEELRSLGLRLLGTANNHTLDYGEEGLFATLENLDRAGLAHAGAGKDLVQAARPGICESRAGRIVDVNCASTFPDGFPASTGRPHFQGRPGLNPLRVDTRIQVGRDLFSRLKEVEAKLAELEGERESEALHGEAESREPADVANVEQTTFQAGDRVDALSTARRGDVRRIAEAIHSARPGARIVMASIHAHESRLVRERPAPFLPPFAHACIDAGADLFVGTGPHVLRGVEIYKGRPIFYSLGNFLFQFYAEQAGFARERRFWQSVVPRLTWEGDHLAAVDLHPITLGFGQPADRRGTPRLARGEEAEQILRGLAELSRPYGTTIAVEGAVGQIRL